MKMRILTDEEAAAAYSKRQGTDIEVQSVDENFQIIMNREDAKEFYSAIQEANTTNDCVQRTFTSDDNGLPIFLTITHKEDGFNINWTW